MRVAAPPDAQAVWIGLAGIHTRVCVCRVQLDDIRQIGRAGFGGQIAVLAGTNGDANFEHRSDFDVAITGRRIRCVEYRTRGKCRGFAPLNLAVFVCCRPIIDGIVRIQEGITGGTNLDVNRQRFGSSGGVENFESIWIRICECSLARIVWRNVDLVRDFIAVIVEADKVWHTVCVAVRTACGGGNGLLDTFKPVIYTITIRVSYERIAIKLVS